MILFIVLLVIISLFFGGNLKTLAPTLAVFGVAALKVVCQQQIIYLIH